MCIPLWFVITPLEVSRKCILFHQLYLQLLGETLSLLVHLVPLLTTGKSLVSPFRGGPLSAPSPSEAKKDYNERAKGRPLTMLTAVSTSSVSIASPPSHLGQVSSSLPSLIGEGPYSLKSPSPSQPGPSQLGPLTSTSPTNDFADQSLCQIVLDLKCFLSSVSFFIFFRCSF